MDFRDMIGFDGFADDIEMESRATAQFKGRSDVAAEQPDVFAGDGQTEASTFGEVLLFGQFQFARSFADKFLQMFALLQEFDLHKNISKLYFVTVCQLHQLKSRIGSYQAVA